MNTPQTTSRPQRATSRSDNDAILNPGTIKINVQGAFIVDDESPPEPPLASPALNATPAHDEEGFEYKHDTSDIRLPNHTTVVSHVAVDVSRSVMLQCIEYP